jgi:sec-independent protein translocase protein TatB
MFSVPHLVIIFIVVLVVFGPHKLPELARGLGKMMAEFRKASTDFKMAFEEEMRNIERQARETEFKKSQEAAAKTEAQPATLATPSEADTSPALPEPATPASATEASFEPVVAPVNEAVSREAHSAAESAPESESVASEAPVTEGTSPDLDSNEEAASNESGIPPAHDQRQPA